LPCGLGEIRGSKAKRGDFPGGKGPGTGSNPQKTWGVPRIQKKKKWQSLSGKKNGKGGKSLTSHGKSEPGIRNSTGEINK